MGANDGIVSTAGMVVGVAGAEVSNDALLVAGIAAVTAGALSMAVGEYVSVSSQRDSERAALEDERAQLAKNPEYGLEQLTGLIQARGNARKLAHQASAQLTERNTPPTPAHLQLGTHPRPPTNPRPAPQTSVRAFPPVA